MQSAHMIGKKWSIPVFEEIALGGFEGFNRFLETMPHLTPKLLALQLRELEEAGLIRKRASREQRTRYALTAKGKDMHELIVRIKEWNVKWNNVSDACPHTMCSACKALAG